MDCESLTPTRGATQQSVDCESLTPTQGATQQSVDCESLTPTRGATQQSVDCESLTPTRGATQQSVGVKKKGKKVGCKIAFSGIPSKGERNQKCSPTKGYKMRSGCLSGAQKRAEVLHHPCIPGDPQQRGINSEMAASPLPSRGPNRGRKCSVTPAFSGVPNIGEQNQKWLPHPYLLGGPKEGGSAMSPLRSRGSPTKGDGNKNGPQKGGSATSPLRSRGSPNKGTKSKVAHKWAEVLCNPYILGGPRKGVQNRPAPGSSKKSHSGGP